MALWNVYVDIDTPSLSPEQFNSVFDLVERDPRCPTGGCVGNERWGAFAYLGVEGESAAQAQEVAARIVADALAGAQVKLDVCAGEVFDNELRQRRRPVDFDGLIVDLDGVVWLGTTPIAGSAEALAQLRADGVQILFLTNDPRGSRADYAHRLKRLDIDAAERDIVTSGRALAALIDEREGAGRAAYVIGSPPLKAELSHVVRVLEGEAGLSASVVAVGGHDGFDYEELRIAARAVRSGARLYAAGRDATFPMPDGPWPGTGSIVAAVEVASGSRAVAAGKPEMFIFDIARSLLAGCRRVAIVGDNLDADIAGGVHAGLQAILVLTGTAAREDLATAPVGPDVVVPDLAALAALRRFGARDVERPFLSS